MINTPCGHQWVDSPITYIMILLQRGLNFFERSIFHAGIYELMGPQQILTATHKEV